MNNIFTGNCSIPITNWVLPTSRTIIDTDIFVWNKITQKLELYNYLPSFDEDFSEKTFFDKSKVFLIPESIKKAKEEYGHYANLESFTYENGNEQLVINLDQWVIRKLDMPLYRVFDEAGELIEEGDDIDYVRMKNILIAFIGEIQLKSNNKIILPEPALNSDATINQDQTYSPFLTLALSTEILTKFIQLKTQDVEEVDVYAIFQRDWNNVLGKIISNPDQYVQEEYIKHSLKKRKVLARHQREPRGINF